MPSVNHLSCSVEVAGTRLRFSEYGVEHGNNTVLCYIVAPPASRDECPFDVRLNAEGFSGGTGLAAFVYIDGEYQCNQNRLGMTAENVHDFELVMYSKEDRLTNGHYVCHDWRFEQLIPVEDEYYRTQRDYSQVGEIEVVVLRTASSQSKNQGNPTQERQWYNKQQNREKKEDKEDQSNNKKGTTDDARSDLGETRTFPESKLPTSNEADTEDGKTSGDATDYWKQQDVQNNDGWDTTAKLANNASGPEKTGWDTDDTKDGWDSIKRNSKNEESGWGGDEDKGNANDQSWWHTGVDPDSVSKDPTPDSRIKRTLKAWNHIWNTKTEHKLKDKTYIVRRSWTPTKIIATPDGVIFPTEESGEIIENKKRKLRPVTTTEVLMKCFGFDGVDERAPPIYQQALAYNLVPRGKLEDYRPAKATILSKEIENMIVKTGITRYLEPGLDGSSDYRYQNGHGATDKDPVNYTFDLGPSHPNRKLHSHNHHTRYRPREPEIKERDKQYIYVPENAAEPRSVPSKPRTTSYVPRRNSFNSVENDHSSWNNNTMLPLPVPKQPSPRSPDVFPLPDWDEQNRNHKLLSRHEALSNRKHLRHKRRQEGHSDDAAEHTEATPAVPAWYKDREPLPDSVKVWEDVRRQSTRSSSPALRPAVKYPSSTQSAKQLRSKKTPTGRMLFKQYTLSEPEPYAIPWKVLQRYGLTHQMQLGEGIMTDKMITREVDYLDSIDNPYATFSFRFRSKKVVEAVTGCEVVSWVGGLNISIAKQREHKARSYAQKANVSRNEHNGKGKRKDHNTVASKDDEEPATDPRYGDVGELCD